MARVLISGIARPLLPALLARRGLLVAGDATGAVAALVASPAAAPALPCVIEVPDAEAAAALLEGGVDDVVLASDPDLLVAARIATLARGHGRGQRLAVGDIAIDLIDRRVERDGRPVALLPREYALLVVLARAAGATLGEAAVRHALSGLACSPGTNVVAVHLSRLRAKLGPGTARIETRRGEGYRLVANAVAAA